jgi:hypothetical protein
MQLKWNWGTGITIVYSLFALGTSGMVAFAMREHVDLVSDDYYDQAVALDAHRAAEGRATALGDAFTIASDPAAARVTIQWPQALPVESGTLTLYRPADAAKDRTVPVALDSERRQIVSLAGLVSGRWMIQVSWRSRGEPYYAEREILVAAAR